MMPHEEKLSDAVVRSGIQGGQEQFEMKASEDGTYKVSGLLNYYSLLGGNYIGWRVGIERCQTHTLKDSLADHELNLVGEYIQVSIAVGSETNIGDKARELNEVKDRIFADVMKKGLVEKEIEQHVRSNGTLQSAPSKERYFFCLWRKDGSCDVAQSMKNLNIFVTEYLGEAFGVAPDTVQHMRKTLLLGEYRDPVRRLNVFLEGTPQASGQTADQKRGTGTFAGTAVCATVDSPRQITKDELDAEIAKITKTVSSVKVGEVLLNLAEVLLAKNSTVFAPYVYELYTQALEKSDPKSMIRNRILEKIANWHRFHNPEFDTDAKASANERLKKLDAKGREVLIYLCKTDCNLDASFDKDIQDKIQHMGRLVRAGTEELGGLYDSKTEMHSLPFPIKSTDGETVFNFFKYLREIEKGKATEKSGITDTFLGD